MRTIQAQFDGAALRRATRFFAGTLEDIFNELLQNARRAGASEVRMSVRPDGTEEDGGRSGQRQLFLPAATIRIAGLQDRVSRVEYLEFSYCC